MISSRLESILPLPAQMAPSALQSVVTGRTMVTVSSPSGWTVISHPMLLGGASRRAFFTLPPVTVKAVVPEGPVAQTKFLAEPQFEYERVLPIVGGRHIMAAGRERWQGGGGIVGDLLDGE